MNPSSPSAISDDRVLEAWKLICGYYKYRYKQVDRRHPYLMDKYWDACVDAMLIVLRTYDGRIPFEKYVAFIARREWNRVINPRNVKKWNKIRNEFSYDTTKNTGHARHVV